MTGRMALILSSQSRRVASSACVLLCPVHHHSISGVVHGSFRLCLLQRNSPDVVDGFLVERARHACRGGHDGIDWMDRWMDDADG